MYQLRNILRTSGNVLQGEIQFFSHAYILNAGVGLAGSLHIQIGLHVFFIHGYTLQVVCLYSSGLHINMLYIFLNVFRPACILQMSFMCSSFLAYIMHAFHRCLAYTAYILQLSCISPAHILNMSRIYSTDVFLHIKACIYSARILQLSYIHCMYSTIFLYIFCRCLGFIPACMYSSGLHMIYICVACIHSSMHIFCMHSTAFLHIFCWNAPLCFQVCIYTAGIPLLFKYAYILHVFYSFPACIPHLSYMYSTCIQQMSSCDSGLHMF